ncbi:MAG: RNA 2',3'-cyclic phosphodiesterase [Candidatus Woesearchaeota archaeon]
MRLFLAINVPEEFHEKLHNLQDELQKYVIGTKNRHFHITLHFFGEKSIQEMSKIIEALQTINYQRYINEEILIRDLDFFGNRVLFLKVYGDRLKELYIDVCNKLNLREEEFIPHLTLYRVKKLLQSKQFIKNIKTEGFKMKMNLCLFESKLSTHEYIIHKKFFW